MADIVTLVMESREKTGKGENGRIRRAGYVPCIIYGPEIKENIKGKVNMREVERILAGRWESTRLNVKLPDGREELCIIREAQRHPLTDMPLHVDFLHLVRGRKINVNIPVEVVGREESQGVKDGGVLEFTHELEVETLPMSIPDVITVDVSGLNIGDAIHVKDLKLPENVSALADPEEVVAIVVMSRGVEDAAPEEEAPAAADVEVVAKGKAAKEDEEESK
ncbi:MAG: 50S ribosomal protein L25 [Synergistales bacterium]|nr:50S ribosomal protein L25 [Synergistales bacterium]MDY6401368.1 50S ribosomal protein L25 [Synergistales bacterium]MDY6404069.1 50S ribosomal protein L25 [Synergistales bacterium]MDY6410014.1 50S ribosomal protein L25 [Synergistales bacterium]MDY6415002.1 50S ribosomal protein L25 [Synergistales bacterium]